MTPSEKRLERLHIVATLIAWPNLTTAEVRDRANDECQHESFDPLPFISPQGIAGKLDGLSRDRLIVASADGNALRWNATDEGRVAVRHYLLAHDSGATG